MIVEGEEEQRAGLLEACCEKRDGTLLWEDLPPDGPLQTLYREREQAVRHSFQLPDATRIIFHNQYHVFAQDRQVNLLDVLSLQKQAAQGGSPGDVCVVLFEKLLEQVSAHLISGHCWQKKRYNNLHYKSFALDKDATPLLSRELLRDELQGSMVMHVELSAPSVATTIDNDTPPLPLEPLFVHRAEEDAQVWQPSDTAAYHQYLLDVAIWLRHFSRSQLLLDNMMESQTAMGVRSYTVQEFLRQTQLSPQLLPFWLEAETLFFKHGILLQHEHCDMTLLQTLLRGHIHDASGLVSRSDFQWQDYMLPSSGDEQEEEECLWQWNDSTGLYRVKFEWLLKIGSQLALQQYCWAGCVELTAQQFYKHLLPVLYREVLLDRFYYFLQWQQQQEPPLLLQTCRLQEILDSQQDCVAYSVNRGIGTPSLVVQRFSEKCDLQRARSSGTTGLEQGADAVRELINRPSLPDIEDMVRLNVLPPCLRKILVEPHQKKTPLKNMDRLNAVMYLSDMGYSASEQNTYLMRHTVKDDVPQQLEGAHKKWQKKRHEKPDVPYVSLPCNAIINLNSDNKDPCCTLRCPYEQQLHGDKRRRSERAEQFQCRTDCYAALGCESDSLAGGYNSVWHPLQYMNLALNKQKGHVK